MSNIFRFKFFNINQENSAHKVGTDAMLLGAFLEANQYVKKALEIGAGTGVIALMLAQKSDIEIDAVEISEVHAEIALYNFKHSDFHQKLSVFPVSLQEFSKGNHPKYDLVFSNPPYFEEQNPYLNTNRKNSRQTDILSITELISCTENLMNDESEFWVILPYSVYSRLIKTALAAGLFCKLQIQVSSYENSKIIRGIFVFSKIPMAMQTRKFYIYEKEKIYSPEYIRLTKEYHFPALMQENQ